MDIGCLFNVSKIFVGDLLKCFLNHETDFADFILPNGVFLTVILLILEWLCWFSAALGEWEWFGWFYSPQCCKCWIFTTLLNHLGEQLYGMADVSIMEIVAGNKTWYRGEHHQPQSQKTIADRNSQHTLKIQKCHCHWWSYLENPKMSLMINSLVSNVSITKGWREGYIDQKLRSFAAIWLIFDGRTPWEMKFTFCD